MPDGVIIKDVSKDEAEEDIGRQESGQASFQGGIQTNREEEEEKDKEEEKRTRSNSTRRSRVMTTIKKSSWRIGRRKPKRQLLTSKDILIPYSPPTPTPKLI